ncbi:hypothetical protein AB0M36_16850 [Actinoplanes sp. NPDC051346]|uniref:hypothetical protein n=1 Tax=Actinoplanes sp. NPDC051346 TaxID=3155048 RepID=UPI0034351E2B
MADDDKKPPPDVNPPTLEMNAPGWPLPATGDIPNLKGDGEEPKGPPPEVPPFSVTVETIREAQSAVLPHAETAVNSYESLRNSTNAKKGWIFQQKHGGDLGETQTWNVASQGPGPVTSNEADKSLAAETPVIAESLDKALLSIADTVRLVGDFTSYMNLAVQTYVRADKNSFLPTE